MKVTVLKYITGTVVLLSLSLTTHAQPVIPNFRECMGETQYIYQELWPKEKYIFDICEEIFYQNYPEFFDASERIFIPRIAHWIWLGSPPPPELLERMKQFKKLHPNWKLKLWTDRHVAALKLINADAYASAANYGEKSDILRYEILERYGGIYFDWDVIFLRSFEDVIRSFEFFAGLSNVPEPLINNAIIGSCPHHPLLQMIIRAIRPRKNKMEETIKLTGPFIFTDCCVEYLKNHPKKVLIFPIQYLHPMPHTQRFNTLFLQKYVKHFTYTVHLHARAWEGL
jgi:mannosyltransferase OCH1-like enzyme